jgi:outer membrane immunogenic protein
MKSYKIVASLFLLSSASALAADLPSIKSAPAAAPAPMWKGFYLGLNAGGGWSSSTTQYGNTLFRSSTNGPMNGYNLAGPAWNTSSSFAGVIGGAQAGYNYSISPMFLVGLEADFQGTSMSGSGTAAGVVPRNGTWSPSTAYAYSSSAVDWFGTVRGRLGVLPFSSLGNVLVFMTGGFAYGGVSAANNFTTVVSDPEDVSYGAAVARASNSSLLTGWTAGGGVEWAPSNLPAWSLKVEYLYTDLGSVRSSAYGLGPTNEGQGYMLNAISNSNAYRFNLVRAGINYHMNFVNVSPVVAKF